jgi:E3 ubiquitin-protein ligase HERC4
VFTFGAGSYGQLGHNSTSHEYLPRKIADLMGSEVTQLTVGRCHVLVYLSSNNRLYSFGLGGSGQLGIGIGNLNKTGPTIIKTELVIPKSVRHVSKLISNNFFFNFNGML